MSGDHLKNWREVAEEGSETTLTTEARRRRQIELRYHHHQIGGVGLVSWESLVAVSGVTKSPPEVNIVSGNGAVDVQPINRAGGTTSGCSDAGAENVAGIVVTSADSPVSHIVTSDYLDIGVNSEIAGGSQQEGRDLTGIIVAGRIGRPVFVANVAGDADRALGDDADTLAGTQSTARQSFIAHAGPQHDFVVIGCIVEVSDTVRIARDSRRGGQPGEVWPADRTVEMAIRGGIAKRRRVAADLLG